MHIESEKLKSFLLDSSLVSRDEIAEAEASVARNEDMSDIGEYFVTTGKINEDDLRRLQAYILGIPYVDIGSEKIPYEILTIIPEPIARNHNVMAFRKNSDDLEVALTDMDGLAAIDFIKKRNGLRILPRLTSTASMKQALLGYQKSLKAGLGDIIRAQMGDLSVPEDTDTIESEENLRKIAEEAPVVRIVDTLLRHAVLQNASDIHIEPLENHLIIRYRIDGTLHDAMTLPAKSIPSITARLKVLANLQLDERRLPQDGRFKAELESETVSFRVSVVPTYCGEKVVLRILRESDGRFSLESLGFHGTGLETLHDALRQKTGLIVTAGPAGSGKSATLYTLLDILNTPNVSIATIEDPVEYRIKRVNQTQVRPEIGLTFAEGLRSLVRQDPDIVMVGEIQDRETASMAVNAALTGHLVLSALPADSAAGSLSRLLDMGTEPFLLASTVRIVIGQRLARRLAARKEKYFLTESAIRSLAKTVDLDKVLSTLKEEKVVNKKATWKTIPFYRPKKSADGDGYEGRIGICEVMRITDTVKDLIIAGKAAAAIDARAKKEGMLSMIEDGIYKAATGVTSIEEVLRVVSN